jgi:hypothetical protein
MKVADAIKAGVAAIPEIRIAGDPTFCIAFLSDKVDICHVNDYLANKGWRMNGLQSPPGFHFCITRPQTVPGLADRFLKDLKEAVAYAATPPPQRPGLPWCRWARRVTWIWRATSDRSRQPANA